LYVDVLIGRLHSGYPGIASGGMSFTVLDGLMGWYLMSHLGRAGFTKTCELQYSRPLHVGKTYRFQVMVPEGGSTEPTNYDLVGLVFPVSDGKEPDEAKPFIKMKASFFLPNRAIAKQVMQVPFGEMGEELFPIE
jgi:hypothetical protein